MDDRLLASGGRVQGLALRTEADFFAQLRASPSAATPVPSSATRRALVGAGSPDITTPEIDALLEKLARGSPSELVDHDAPNNLPSSASERAAVTPTRAAAARRSPKSAGRGGRPRWTSAGPDERGVWVPVEQMPKPPPSFAPHSSATPGRSTPTALVGDVVTRVSDTGERVQYVTPKRRSSDPAEAGGDPNPNPNSHPGGVPEPDVATGAALYADFSRERDHPSLPYSRLPVFERLYRRIPEGQRRKFAFSPGADAGTAIGAEKSPSTSNVGSVPKELVEKRREIESLRAELAAREKSETAGDAARRAARALEAARRGTPNGLPPHPRDETSLDETFDGTESDDEREEAALAREEAAHIARLAEMHGASPHKGEYSATRVSARPTDVPVVRIEDDPESVAWELSSASYDQTSKPPWQERLRVAEERRAAKAAAWEEEVRERADAKRTNDRLIAEAEAELEALRRKRADVVERQRRRRALAIARADPKNLPRKRSPWGMAGSPGTIDNIRNMSPARGGPVGTRPTFDWTSPWRAEKRSREKSGRANSSTPDRRTPASRPASAARPPRGGYRSPSSAARPATAPSTGGSVARILADAAAAGSRGQYKAQPSLYNRAQLYASPSDAARAAAERVRARKRAQEERERAAAAAAGPGPARRARKAPAPAPPRRDASRAAPAPAKPEAPPLSWVTVPLASADPPGTKPPTRRELYPTPPTPPRAKPPPTPPRSPARGTGAEARRWAEASTVEKLSDEVHVVKRLVKDQGVHLFGEVEGIKQQMGAMFEMMERVLGKIGDVGGGSAAAKAPGSPFVSG